MNLSALLLGLVFTFTAAGCDESRSGTDASSLAGITFDELTQAIADHAAQPAAHHTKTTSADELVTGTLDPERLPPITIATSSITSTASDGSVFPHNCAWARSNDNSNVGIRTVTCPAGKHPISGSCVSNSLGITLLSSQPVNGNSIIANGAAVTAADGWTCLFNGAATTHIARALCCHY